MQKDSDQTCRTPRCVQGDDDDDDDADAETKRTKGPIRRAGLHRMKTTTT